MSTDLTVQDRFTLRQRIRPIVNQYEFTAPDGTPVAFVEQKRFKFKEDIRFYADDSKREEVLRIKARQRFDPRARYDVTDPAGAKIGEIQKVFGASLLRSTYALFDAGERELAIVTERSLAVAILRRLSEFIPYVGGFLPIPYHFVFKRDEAELGSHVRRIGVRDIYEIDMSADPERTIDRRLVLAIAVGIDALQAR